ncbi:MAG: proton-conducting transporter membrane subunit [Pseudomonadota bacterium]
MGILNLILAVIIVPGLAAFTNWIFAKRPNLRDTLTLLIAFATFGLVLTLFRQVGSASLAPMTLLEVFPGITLAFHVEPLGMMFAMIASGLWILTHIYGVGYMRGNNEKAHAQFFACFAVAISAVMALAFSANLFTLFLFYEVLTVSTYPLVAHKGTAEAIRGARIYIGILMSTSIALFLTGVIWVFVVSGTLDFVPGGILEGTIDAALLPVLLGLFAFGIGKAALMPFHKWLPNAMVAPTPVSALLHAVAVVKAGVFTMLKVGIYTFGVDFLADTGASTWLSWLAAYSILAASIVAMNQDNLKARLAYSTVSQLSYVTLGMALATQMGVIGGGMQIATHAVGKITLFMCAGAIYVAAHKTKVSELDGLGRAMPITFTAFLIGALSIIGLPPLAGSWSKFSLMMGAAEADQLIMIGVLMVSSILNVAYLLPIVGRGFFAGPKQSYAEANVLLWLPPAITAGLCILVFFYAGRIQEFLMAIVGV